jgi:hypothetical protein
MIGLCCCDLAFNSFVEFDDFYGSYSHKSRVFVFGCQLLIQLSIFYTLFLMMGETYLFKVGLLNILVKQFAFVLFFHPLYVTWSVVLGFYRINEMRKDTQMYELWSLGGLPYFIPLSVGHKIVASFFYLLNIRAAIRLGSTFYYSKDAWVELYYATDKERRFEESKDRIRKSKQ